MMSEALSKSLRGVEEGKRGVTRIFPIAMEVDPADEVGAQRGDGCCTDRVERDIHAGSDIGGVYDEGQGPRPRD